MGYGVTGLLGLMWRTAEIAPQLSALSRVGWNSSTTAEDVWVDFCQITFGPDVASEAAMLFRNKVDGFRYEVNGWTLPEVPS